MKKSLKRVIAVILVVCCMMSLVACGKGADTTDGANDSQEADVAETADIDNADVEDDEVTDGDTADVADEEVEEPAYVPEPYVDKLDRSDEGFVLVWNDEFDGDSLDTTKWDYMYGNGGEYGKPGWGNYEMQYYLNREENIRVEDGRLIITAMKEEGTAMKYTSARIRTVTNSGDVLFATTYGRVEARIKMPAGEGLWPAFWMLPVDESTYGMWAASGEIDIMEAKGRLPQQFSCAAHYGREYPQNVYSGQEYTFPEGTSIEDYHLYSIEWEPGEIRYYVDNECYFTLNDFYSETSDGTSQGKTAPFDVPFYLMLNMAIGGRFDPQANLNNVEFPKEMEVDFVRVYHKEEGYEIAE